MKKNAEAVSELPREPSPDLAPVVGANLRRIRVKRGLSLERLARASGVSRAMLGQIELAQSAPTINLLWKIAHALSVPFSALLNAPRTDSPAVLRRVHARTLRSHDGSFSSRALFPAEPASHNPADDSRRVEFYELRLGPHSEERADAHSQGTRENLVVSQGTVEIELGARREILGPGDAIMFEADKPHVYRNGTATEAVMFLVMTYADTVG